MCALLVPSFAVMYKLFAPLVYDALKTYKTILHQDLIINQTQIYAQDTVDATATKGARGTSYRQLYSSLIAPEVLVRTALSDTIKERRCKNVYKKTWLLYTIIDPSGFSTNFRIVNHNRLYHFLKIFFFSER